MIALASAALLAAASVAGGPSPASIAASPAPPPVPVPGPDAAPPAPDASRLPALLAKARATKLAEDPGWIRLGHWRRRTFGGWKSEADGAAFFKAKDGKTDPAAELEATLLALFDATPRVDELDDAACRFPGRLQLLRARLGIDETALPPRPCPRWEAFRDRVAPVGVTLVFSSYYLNNPSSSFGHTFLRLDKSEGAREGERAELLDYGVDYAATVDTGNAVLYALKGLFGLFHGSFNHYAYYYKVREYADAESRDLWEYDLALAPDEVRLLVAHLWELGGTWFDYWYLDENCSYHVLGALEAAAPRVSLLEHVGARVVLPSDTVKALFRNPGLVREVHYRPSILTQFRARIAPLSPRAVDAVEALSGDPAAPIPASLGAERASILDAALDHLDLRAGKDLALGKDPVAARRRQVLLERRAALAIPSPPLVVAPPTARAPEVGHGSFRLGAGGGLSRDQGPLVLLDLRLALHDLGDPPVGFPEVAHIEFGPTRLRIAPRERRVELDETWLVRIVSLNDFSRFDRRPSWQFRVGAETVRDAGGDGKLAAAASMGGGFSTLELLGIADLLASADVDLLASPGLEGFRGSGVRLGVGPSAILRLRGGTRGALLAEARWRWLPEASPRETWRLSAQARLHLTQDLSLALEARRAPRDETVGAVLLGYF
jgi:hypothetical protein